MIALLLAAALPGLIWDGPAPGPEAAGISRRCTSAEAAGYTRLPTPGIRGRAEEASATRQAWIIANGWRFERYRARNQVYRYELPSGKTVLAVAEAFAWDADVWMKIDPAELPHFARMSAFLRAHAAEPMPPVVNIGMLDDGSPLAGEIMNLMARKNLLFQVISSPEAGYDFVFRLGSEKPKTYPANPADYAESVRKQLGDEKRAVRIYGTSSVLVRLTGAGGKARLHLVNFTQNPIEAVRVRVKGEWSRRSGAAVDGSAQPAALALEDSVMEGGFTEFTIPSLPLYAIIDLGR